MTRIVAHAIPRDLPAGMNKLEAAYRDELEAKRLGGLIREWSFNSVRLALGGGAWFKPDFFVVQADGTCEIHETKGFQREAALVRLKVAARLYPFRFFRITQGKDGYFHSEDFTEGETHEPA